MAPESCDQLTSLVVFIFIFLKHGLRNICGNVTTLDAVLELLNFKAWNFNSTVLRWQHYIFNISILSTQISVENVRSGRIHTLITSAFSHVEIGHIVSNMIGLYFFGMNVWLSFFELLLGPDFICFIFSVYVWVACITFSFVMIFTAFLFLP